MKIDIHAHIIVKEITRAVDPSDTWRPRVGWEEGRQFVEFGGKRNLTTSREFVDAEAILAEQDRAGVDRVLLTPWSSLFRYDADLETSLRANRVQNDALSRLTTEHRDRILALGTVPLRDSEAAVAELKRAVNDLGLLGVEIGTNVNGACLGDARFRPFWAAAEALGAVVEVHPVAGVGGPTKQEYYLWNTFGYPAETALTASHMIFSGLFEDHPDLNICLFHGGGHLPYQIGRLDRAYEINPGAGQRINAPPSTYFKKFYFDTITHSVEALSYLIHLVGIDRVMMGSDYPFDIGYERPAEIIERVPGLSESDKKALLGGNARQLPERG